MQVAIELHMERCLMLPAGGGFGAAWVWRVAVCCLKLKTAAVKCLGIRAAFRCQVTCVWVPGDLQAIADHPCLCRDAAPVCDDWGHGDRFVT